MKLKTILCVSLSLLAPNLSFAYPSTTALADEINFSKGTYSGTYQLFCYPTTTGGDATLYVDQTTKKDDGSVTFSGMLTLANFKYSGTGFPDFASGQEINDKSKVGPESYFEGTYAIALDYGSSTSFYSNAGYDNTTQTITNPIAKNDLCTLQLLVLHQ